MNVKALFLVIFSLISWSIASAPKTSLNKCVHELTQHRSYIESIIDLSGIDNFKEVFPEFSLIKSQDNVELINLAFDENPENVIYFDGEIAILKLLNDEVIKDKDLVTKLVNLHKNLFVYYLTRDHHTTVQNHLIAKYSDFKSLRLAFKKYSPELMAEMNDVFQSANNRFRDIIRIWHIVPEEFNLDRRNLIAHPKRWFLMGTGPTVDAANIAARWMRTNQIESEVQILAFENIEKELKKLAILTEKQRKDTLKRLKRLNPNMVQKAEGSDAIIPSEQLLKIITKTKIQIIPKKGLTLEQRDELRKKELNDFILAVRKRMALNYNLKEKSISDKLIISLRDYLSHADTFSPSIFVENRQEQHLELAQGEILSVDFAGQNIKNMIQTLSALVTSYKKDLLSILDTTRQGEVEATRNLKEAAANLHQFLKNTFSNHLSDYILSGDDGIAFFEKGYKVDLPAILTYLSSLENPQSLRFTLTHQGVAAEDRSIMIVHAENLEKEIRVQLENYVSVEEIEKTGLIIENMGVSTNTSSFRVYSTGPVQLDILNNCLNESLRKLGYDEETVKNSQVFTNSQ